MNAKFKISIKFNSAIAVAEYIQDKYKINNPIKLQKLLFFLTLESLKTRDKLLFTEKFEAWVYGPVVPEVYHHFRSSSNKYSYHTQLNFVKKLEESELKNFIDSHIGRYLKLSALELRDWAHETMPWISSRSGYDEKERSRTKIKTQALRTFAHSQQFEQPRFRPKKENYE